MAERMTALSVATLFGGDHNHPEISRFIDGFSSTLHCGDGRKPQLLNELGIDVDFPLRLLLGVPAKQLTRAQRLLAEAYCSMFFERDLGDTKGLWTGGKGWAPVNNGRIAARIENSTLDIDWMLKLGISRTVWDKTILISNDALERTRKGQTTSMTIARYLLSLAAFGFSDPYQFFTAKKPERE